MFSEVAKQVPNLTQEQLNVCISNIHIIKPKPKYSHV